MAGLTPNPLPGQSYAEYTEGTGVTYDGLSSSVGTGESAPTVTGQDSGGITATTDSQGNVTLSGYILIVSALAAVPASVLPSSTSQGFLVYLRGSGLRVYDPSTGNWASV
jgi:hypothetical protein